MRKKQLLQTQVSSKEEVQESDKITVFEEIHGTPFTAIFRNGKWLIVMGDSLASNQEFNNLEDLKKFVEKKEWSLILVASAIFNNITDKEGKNEK